MKNSSLLLLLSLFSCTSKTEYFTLEDYKNVCKIDAHIHVRADRDVFVEQARADAFQLMNITVDSKDAANVDEQYAACLDQKNRHPKDYEFATAFPMEGWDDADWVNNTLNRLEKDFEEGAIAVKVWKNIGMVFKDKNGALIMIDNPRLDTLFKALAAKGIPVIGHLGEPKNCWLPLEEMTTNNDKSYFENNPQYHMYKHPELPSYEDQIAARDRMLENNPDLIFIGAHLGSLEWSVDELSKRLDKFPNMSVDMAARMGQLFYQTKSDREKVRAFFIKYQDRLLYGTDLGDGGDGDPAAKKEYMHKEWFRDWQYLVSDDKMTSDLISGEFKGLKLPSEVVNKIYYNNAMKWFKMFAE